MDKCQLANYTAFFIRQMEKEDKIFDGLFNSVLKYFIKDIESLIVGKNYYFSNDFPVNISYIFFDHGNGLYINGKCENTSYSYPLSELTWGDFR